MTDLCPCCRRPLDTAPAAKTPAMGLTPKQARVLGLIREGVAANGIAPSVREIADALGHQSTCGAHRLLVELEERGAIRRLPNRARAIEVLA